MFVHLADTFILRLLDFYISLLHFYSKKSWLNTLYILNFVCVFLFLQHYTKDADGLCTRLIKPKLMEGTVAAQDEFSRSKINLWTPVYSS